MTEPQDMTAAILQELAVELRDEPLICEVIPCGTAKHIANMSTAKKYYLVGVLEIYHLVTGGPKTGVRRFTVGVRGESLELTETAGPAKLGKVNFDLANPKSFELAIAHIRGRLAHWSELARLFPAEGDQ
jgi:hypothetical protein